MDSSEVDERTAHQEALGYHKIFREQLCKRSNCKDIFELACKEWELEYCEVIDDDDFETYQGGKCICTKDIKKNFYMRNKYNNNQCIIGIDCFKTMEHIDRKLEMAKAKKMLDIKKNPHKYCKICENTRKKKVRNEEMYTCPNCDKIIKLKGEVFTYRMLIKEKPKYVKWLLKQNYYSLYTDRHRNFVDYVRKYRLKKPS
jgi:hypothetical protein